jgi:hypothetical protein
MCVAAIAYVGGRRGCFVAPSVERHDTAASEVAVAAEAPEHRRHSGLQRGRGPQRIGHDASRTWNEDGCSL